MKRHLGSTGFTIVEVMIVLAVTGILFVTIAATLSGRQNSNEFTQSINDVQSQIQQIISNVQNGYYPNNNNFQCTDTTGSGKVQITGGSNTQGTNGACVFLGEVIQFGNNGNNQQLVFYPIAAANAGSPAVPAPRTSTNLSAIGATPIVSADGTTVNDTATYNTLYGLSVVKASYSAAGILASLGSGTAVGAANRDISTYGLAGINGPANITPALADPSLQPNPPGGVKICFQSAGTSQYGLVTIGQNNRQLSVGLQIMDVNAANLDCGL